VLDLARDKHGFELCRKIRCPVGYVQIPQGQNEHHPQESKTKSLLGEPAETINCPYTKKQLLTAKTISPTQFTMSGNRIFI